MLPAEVARVDSLTGHLQLPGAWPVAQVGLKYRKHPPLAERSVPRESKKRAVGIESTEREAARPSTKTMKGTPGASRSAAGRTPEAEAAVGLWESDRSTVEVRANDGKMEGVRTD